MVKKDILKDCVRIMEIPRVSKWYEKNLMGDSQANTIRTLHRGITDLEISIDEALSIALVVGFQWNEKFNTKHGVKGVQQHDEP